MEKGPFRVPPGACLRAHGRQVVAVGIAAGDLEDVAIVGYFGWIVW